jgi:hypothetical protein
MAKPKIDAMEALSLINAGVDNATLMKKFNLSVKGLHSLYEKLINEGLLEANAPGSSSARENGRKAAEQGRELSAREVLRDIRSGMSDPDLMEKYSLSAKGLDHLFMQLLGAGLISGNELQERSIEPDSTVDLKDSLLSSAILEGRDSEGQDEMVPVEVEYEPPSSRQTTDIVDDYEKSTTVEPARISKTDRCPVCGKALMDDADLEDETEAEANDGDDTEAILEEDAPRITEILKDQTDQAIARISESVDKSLAEYKQESLSMAEDMLKVTGKSIGNLSNEIAELKELLQDSALKRTGPSIGSIVSIIISLAVAASMILLVYTGSKP